MPSLRRRRSARTLPSWLPRGRVVRQRSRGVRPVLSTVHAGRAADDPWTDLVDVMGLRPPRALPRQLVAFIRAARGRRAVILRGTVSMSDGYGDLLAGVLLRVLARDVRVVVSDATIEPGSAALAARLAPGAGPVLRLLSRLLVHAVDSPRVVWCVLSTAEVDGFRSAWGIRHGEVVFTPFSHSFPRRQPVEGVRNGEHVFSGGSSLRDYGLLLESWTEDLPPLRVATRRPVDGVERAHGVIEVGPTSPADFMRLMASSRVVVLPLARARRSTGQQTCLNALLLGRPLVVTDTPGVRDHVEDGVTGLVVPSDAAALRAAVRRLVGDPALADRLGSARRRSVLERFEPRHYRRRLLEVAGVIDRE